MTQKIHFILLLLFQLVLLSHQSSAREENPPLTEPAAADALQAPPVEALVQEALAKSPSVEVLRERIESSQEAISPEGALPDPMIEIMMQDVNFPEFTVGDEEMSMVGVQVKQGLPYPGQLQSRRNRATAEAKERHVELQQWRRNLELQVRLLYAELYAVDKELESLGFGRELLDMLSETVSMRYSTGETEQEAVIKAQLEISRLKEQELDLAADRKGILAKLNRLLDRSGDATLAPVRALPEVKPPLGTWSETVVENAPDILQKQAALDTAARRVEEAQFNTKPTFSVGAGVFSRGDFDQVVTLQVGMEFPLWKKRKQEPLVRVAEHELQMIRHDLREAKAAARADAARLAAEWERNQEQIRLYREAILPQTSAAMDAARFTYLAGKGDYSMVVEDFSRWLEARVQLSRRESARYAVWAEIEFLTVPIGGEEN